MKKTKSISILFIGNSFSYYHSLPKLLARFARALKFGNLIVDGLFRGGATLKMLWHDDRTLKKLRSKAWDYVVLQERGRLGGIVKSGVVHVGRPKIFFAYATRFDKEIKKIGAKTILYCPPAFLGTGFADDAQKLHTAYVSLAHKLHAMMIPTGVAFARALRVRPSINLFERDGHHPSPLGTYLIASLFYRKLLREKAANLPFETYVSRSEKLPKNPRIEKLSRSDARFLWSVANCISLGVLWGRVSKVKHRLHPRGLRNSEWRGTL